MPPLFREYTVSSVAKYASVLAKLRDDRVLWFRGQNNLSWKLVPSLARRRKDWLSAEAMLMKRFRQNALALLQRPPATDWEWLLLMQHYGVPTRLLDWTENALAALYFASVSMRGRNTSGQDGCVWCLDPLALNKESFPTGFKAWPCLDVDVELDDYLPDKLLAPTVRPPIAVLAMRQFPRLVAQSGVFTLTHKESVAIEAIKDGAYVGRIVIPGESKRNVARELASMGITRLSLFPELESVAALAKELVP